VNRLLEAFEANFAAGLEVGASVSVFHKGHEICSLHGGFCDSDRTAPWDKNTLSLVWSATKGPSSSCVLHAMQAAKVDLTMRVAEFWPEFATGGKEEITLAHILSHRAGLCALDSTSATAFDRASVIAAIESQPPVAPIGTHSAYGPRIYGYLIDEIVRRLAEGEPLGDYWRRVFADPLGLDFWIGLPRQEHHRVATMLSARIDELPAQASDTFAKAFADPSSLTRRAFACPRGLGGVASMNTPPYREAHFPAMGGIGSASALARFYSILAEECSGRDDGIFMSTTRGWLNSRLVQGVDRVLQKEMAFAAGFMMDPLDGAGQKIRQLLGPTTSAFGHAGAGGGLAFADPEHRIGFAYVMNKMEPGVLPGKRCLSLVEAAYQDLVEY
jgi:CubicO group peptidase (beta-lactamase class C family)